jgi:alanine dehydrogenase
LLQALLLSSLLQNDHIEITFIHLQEAALLVSDLSGQLVHCTRHVVVVVQAIRLPFIALSNKIHHCVAANLGIFQLNKNLRDIITT